MRILMNILLSKRRNPFLWSALLVVTKNQNSVDFQYRSGDMLQNKVAGALFRSLLRWNRRPEVVSSKFAIDGVGLGIAKFLPLNATITNAEGVQAAIYHCFRSGEATQDNLDLGFKVLRDLTEVSQTLALRCNARDMRAKPENQSIATFRVGQVVQHKDFSVRGVVTGWSLDETNSKQVVEVLPDLVDANELAGYPSLFAVVKVDEADLQLVEDKDLHRVISRDMKLYFDGYDISRRRYIPNVDLKYWYQSDIQALESSAVSGKDRMPATQLRQLHKSLFTVQRTVTKIGCELRGIVERHASRPQEVSSADQAVAQQILDEVNKCINGCIQSNTTAPVPLPGHAFQSPDDAPKEKPVVPPFARSLVRGGAFRAKPSTSETAPADTNASAEVKKSKVRMNSAEAERVFYAVGYLGNCFSAVDQLLQLRFQARGIAFHDGLAVQSGADSEHKVVEVPSCYEDARKWNLETASPAALYKVGQVIKHKKFGYRGVIAGFDQRPSIDMSKWEGIMDLEHGQEQPIYKVIPDEGDVQDMLGEQQFRSSYLVAQENIELVTERPDFLVHHRHLASIFQGFDFASGTYRVPPKLQYCFPDVLPVVSSVESSSASAGGAPGVQRVFGAVDELLLELLAHLRKSMSLTRTNDALYRAAQIPATEIAEDTEVPEVSEGEVAVQSPEGAGEPTAALSMQDLLIMLKYAKSQDHALYVESMLWLVWVAHTSPDISKLMRLSIAHAKRGNMDEAIEIVSRAIDLDPRYAEAYNKRASYHHVNQAYDECIENAQASLEIFPDHVGALSGLSLCFEQRDKPEQAIKAVRKALELHPWAAHLPTMLISMQAEFKKPKRKSGTARASSSNTDVFTTDNNAAVRDV